MTKYQLTPNDGALVAIDVAKARNEVLIDIPGSGRRRRLTVLNERPDHDHLVELLRVSNLPIVCGFEATGNYRRPLAWRLLEAGFEVKLISSVALARTREALHNSSGFFHSRIGRCLTVNYSATPGDARSRPPKHKEIACMWSLAERLLNLQRDNDLQRFLVRRTANVRHM
jgi:hypothetical protein